MRVNNVLRVQAQNIDRGCQFSSGEANIPERNTWACHAWDAKFPVTQHLLYSVGRAKGRGLLPDFSKIPCRTYEVHGLLIKHIIYCMHTNYVQEQHQDNQLQLLDLHAVKMKLSSTIAWKAICSHCMEAATDHVQAPGGRNTDCVCLQDNSSNIYSYAAGRSSISPSCLALCYCWL